jgi:putative glutamine amidotransferase
MQPLIAITVGEIIHKEAPWAPVVYGQFHTYADAVVRAGGVPFILPLVDSKPVLRKLYEQCTGLLLSGGDDLNPDFYNSPRQSKTISASRGRDKQEIQLLIWALEDDKPVLGICRGMHLLNVALGGSLHQDISSNLPAAGNHTLGIDKKDFRHLAHRLAIAPDSQLAAILGQHQIKTNTLHHQAVDVLGGKLAATAHAEDGVIEAIELPGKRFVIGVQSHPEALEAETETEWRRLFEAFVSSAAASAKAG